MRGEVEILVEVWSWDLKLKFEVVVEACNWSEVEGEVWCWSLKFLVLSWSLSLKLIAASKDSWTCSF